MVATIKKLGMIEPDVVMAYMLLKYEKMSHLKMQKILYYTQAFHLAHFDQPLMNIKFEAWVHGPVSRKVYSSLKDKSILHSEIGYVLEPNERHPKVIIDEILTDDQVAILDDVLETFASWTGPQLEAQTHSELPWINARGAKGPSEPCNSVISNDEMKSFYKQYLD